MYDSIKLDSSNMMNMKSTKYVTLPRIRAELNIILGNNTTLMSRQDRDMFS